MSDSKRRIIDSATQSPDKTIQPDGIAELRVGGFRLKQGNAGKIWMTSTSGQTAEIDEKVLEDLLRSFF